MIDPEAFLAPRVSQVLHETIHSGSGVHIVYAEMHWTTNHYSFLNLDEWKWVKPSEDPGYVASLKLRARKSAIRSLSLGKSRVVEITTKGNEFVFEETIPVPGDILNPPFDALTDGHWCTEMISLAVWKLCMLSVGALRP